MTMVNDEDSLIAVQEFQYWYESNSANSSSADLPYLTDHKRLKDGSVKLEMSFPVDNSEFFIVCPDGYPRATNVAVRTNNAKLSKWATIVNEFINGKPGGIKLPEILNKCVECFTSKSSPLPMEVDRVDEDSDFEDAHTPDDERVNKGYESDPDELMEDNNFTTQFDIQMDLLKKRWLVKENDMRQKLSLEKAKIDAETSTGQKCRIIVQPAKAIWPFDPSSSSLPSISSKTVKEGEQIFDHDSAAFQILSNEMISMLQSGESAGFKCNAVDDSLYKWNVRMSNFSPDSRLSQELKQLKDRFGFDYIELQLDFVPDYPFYPPLLRIVRPRFQGSLVQSLASIDLLKLTYWNPAKTVSDVLMSIKEILMQHAILDLTNPKNDPVVHPEGAYLPLEDYLIKLALASEVRPRANFEIINIDNLEKAPLFKSGASTSSTSTKCFAGNTNVRGGWKAGVGYGSGRGQSTWTPETYLKATKEKDRQILFLLKNISDEIMKAKADKNINITDFYSVLEGSSLVPYFEKMLSVFIESSIELSNRAELYSLTLDIVDLISDWHALLPLVCNLSRQEYCLMVFLEKLKKSAEEFKSVSQKLKKTKHKLEKSNVTDKEDDVNEDLEWNNAKKIISLYEKISKNLALANLRYSCEAQVVTVPKDNKKEDLESMYKRVLKPLQFDQCRFESLKSTSWSHYYHDKCKDNYSNEAKSIWKEWSVLQSSLPLSVATGLFVRYDDEKINLLRALIIGPEDTPYANGCFLFDICFPVGYPEKPPLVNLLTTGGGRVRFNPNLYNNGKVCLSLLGTWSGEKGESWNSKTSTLLQVLVSIQSLILVEQPYFNEPGYESTMGTPEGNRNSENYNKNIRKNCIQLAMIDIINSPPPSFENIIKFHFKLKKTHIIEQAEKWLSEDSDMKSVVGNLKTALNKLNTVEVPKK